MLSYGLQTLNQIQEKRLNYTFFRGTKDMLMGGKVPEPSETLVTLTVVQQGKPDIQLQCPGMSKLCIYYTNSSMIKSRSKKS